MDPVRAWLWMAPWQKLCFLFLFTVTAITIWRGVRLAWWLRGRAKDERNPQFDAARAVHQWRRAKRLAPSTRGLAQAALWFTCSAAAGGMYLAGIVLENSARSPVAIVAENSLYVIDAMAIGLGLSGLLCGAGVVFGVLADSGIPRLAAASAEDLAWPRAMRAPSGDRVLSAVRYASRALGAIAIILAAAAVMEIHPTYAAALVGKDDRFVGFAIFLALSHLWSRLALLFAAMGALTWLCVLVESARSRRSFVETPATPGRRAD